MTHLDIRLLGGFDVVDDGRSVTGFESAATEALLARLAAEPGLPVARAELAELLWPGRPTGRALANLRHALAVLRRAIGDDDRDHPVLVATRGAVAFDAAADVRVDVVDFRALARTPPTAPGAVAAWEAAVAARRGPFLAGFDAGFGEGWETWVLTAREEIDALAAAAYQRLADLRERTGETDRALALVRDWLAVDRWNEDARLRLIRLLALDGRAAAALEHADAFVAELRHELGVEPTDELVGLVDDVRAGRLNAPAADVPGRSARVPPPPAPPCVAREDELAWLHGRLDDAIAGAGGAAFVAGAAGAGKTVLLRAFADEARARMPELCVLAGAGNAFTGSGDPFLPFRQILALLCGDVDRAGAPWLLTAGDAARLWSELPATVEVVLDDGPYLLETLIDAPALGRRFERGFPNHPVGTELAGAIDLAVRRADDPMRQHRPVLDQCARVLTRLAGRRPMLLLVDDLHWADRGTIELLRHLAAQVGRAPILVVAAFRPPEHPLAGQPDAIAELVRESRSHSRAECLLELTGSRGFVDGWLDRDPNLIGDGFRERLYRATGGHALFTVETVAAMRRRGDLVVDERGRWTPSGAVEWDALPPRVEATIAARTMQLPAEVRRDLAVASVQGESFLAEVVADARSMSPADVVLRLGELAVPPNALVVPVGVEQLEGRGVERYRFRHDLIRQFLYEHLVAPDRRALHGATGRSLAARYADRVDEVAVDLAFHYERAGLVEETISARALAGRRAMRLAATSEAIEHLGRAVELVRSRRASAERDRRELELLTPLGACLQAHAGYNAPVTDEVYQRIRELIPSVGTSFESAQALGALTTVDGLRARYDDAIGSAERLLELAIRLGSPAIESVAHMQLGWLLLMRGRLVESRAESDRAVEMYDDEWDGWLTYAVGAHVRSTALAWRALAECYLGHPDQARRDAVESIADARRTGYPFALTFALAIAGCAVSDQLGEHESTLRFAGEEAEIAEREGFAFYRAAARVHHGLALAKCSRPDDGIAEVEAGLARWSELGTEAFRCLLAALQAERLLDAARLDDAAAVLADIEHRVAVGEEQLVESHLPVIRARLLRSRGDVEAADAVLRRGLSQLAASGALGPRLRTASLLAELLVDRGRGGESRSVLEPALAAVSGGADTVDARRARELLAVAATVGPGASNGPSSLDPRAAER